MGLECFMRVAVDAHYINDGSRSAQGALREMADFWAHGNELELETCFLDREYSNHTSISKKYMIPAKEAIQ